MTALSVSARAEDGTSLRPVPWQRMGWVTWRQHRATLAWVVVFLGALTVAMLLAGHQLHSAYTTAVAACQSGNSLTCPPASVAFDGTNGFLANGFILQAVPVLIGAFAGAPVLARELETGTFRYAWTLGVGRRRWTVAKLVPLAVTVTAGAGLLSLLFSWYYQPLFTDGNSIPLDPALFSQRGVAYAAWTLVAVAIGALAGMLIRRVVPAMAATLAAYLALALLPGLWLRQHYLPAVHTTSNNVPGFAWILDQWYTKGGKFAFQGVQKSGTNAAIEQHWCPNAPPSWSLGECLSHHGYTQWTSYQPVTRFWPFQWIEAGWLLVLAALLIAATVWLVRRRAT